MRASARPWIWLSRTVLASGVLCILIFRPHVTRPEAPAAISDLSQSNPLNQPNGGDVAAEAYEVYSALYQQPQQEPLAFAGDSRTDIPQVNGSCLRPATPQQHEMADAFAAANQKSHRWEKKFTIPAGYVLLSPSESASAQDCLAILTKSTPACKPYQSLRHVRYLGVPGFDHAHSRALVSVIKMCGNQCGGGGIFEVEKSGNTWRRADPTSFTSECSWMY
jgi:hypothetical protein